MRRARWGRSAACLGATTKLRLQERLAGLHRDLEALGEAAARESAERMRGLQLAARGLRQAESTSQWVQILADAAAPLAGEVAFFRVVGDVVRCEAARGMDLIEGEIPLAGAAAIRQAVETRETVVSLLVPSQVGAMGTAGSRRRAHLFPLVGKTRVFGVMAAIDDAGPDVYAMEVLLSLGAASLELRNVVSAGLIGVAAAAPVVAIPTAMRYARTVVASWILDYSERVAAGRAAGNVYGSLRAEIDAARGVYAVRYLPGPDHLHEEMLARLALGDSRLLGAEYVA